MKSNFLHAFRTLSSLILIVSAFTLRTSAQCTSSVSTFPATINGVTVNFTSTNPVTVFGSAYGSPCGFAVPANSQYYGQSTYSNTVGTYTFSQPVNNVTFLIAAATNFSPAESFTFNTNAASTTVSGSSVCGGSLAGNTFTATTSSDAGGAFTVTGSSSFTTLTITHNQDPANNGSLLALCANSIVAAAPNATLTKAASPTTITQGGVSTYTFTLNNSATGSTAQSGLGFTDALPSGLVIAPTPGVTSTGFSTAPTVTATAGGNTITVSGAALAAATSGTITVNVTNAPGQTNSSCPNPAFTNAGSNITGTSTNLTNNVGTGAGTCIVVNPACAAAAGTISGN